MNKRGQGLSTNAIILIVLGVVVLVLVIFGFTTGWKNLSKYIKQGANVDDIQQACELACSLGKSYDYCFVKRELISQEETLEDSTCYFLAKKRTKYEISLCPDITCKIFEDQEEAKALCETAGEKIDYLGGDGIISYECKEEDISA